MNDPERQGIAEVLPPVGTHRAHDRKDDHQQEDHGKQKEADHDQAQHAAGHEGQEHRELEVQ